MKLSTGLVNAMLATGSLRSQLNGFELRVYSGIAPSSADDAIGSAVLIGKYTNGGTAATFAATATDGILTKNTSETLSGTSVAAGTMSFYRLVLAADDGTASTTAPRVQDAVGLVGTTMVVPTTTVASVGAPLPPVTALTFQMPRS